MLDSQRRDILLIHAGRSVVHRCISPLFWLLEDQHVPRSIEAAREPTKSALTHLTALDPYPGRAHYYLRQEEGGTYHERPSDVLVLVRTASAVSNLAAPHLERRAVDYIRVSGRCLDITRGCVSTALMKWLPSARSRSNSSGPEPDQHHLVLEFPLRFRQSVRRAGRRGVGEL